MQIAWFYRSGIAVAAVTVLLVGTSLQAAESAGASARSSTSAPNPPLSPTVNLEA